MPIDLCFSYTYAAVIAVQKLYNEAKDHKLPMEALNRYGGKFIKEVKVGFCAH